ncbi:ankyrin repeat domain-containing protein [Leptospira meyeri]|uniref:ankyrin repeat domain-containing protein n=1 Tax=Leptospira meyeri TaxID=29508 RepID=UPI001FD48279|nr:ankyrin repeat domain-containing protein [Leptospira meyeri]
MLFPFSFLSADSDLILTINRIAESMERISVKIPTDHSYLTTTSISYTNTMSVGSPAPKLVYVKTGEYFLSYNDGLSKPIYLTNSIKQRERIPRIVPFGEEHLFLMWMTDDDTEKDKWFPKIIKMNLEACLIQKNGTIISKPQTFGSGKGLSFRSAARFFHLPDGRFGWVNDLTGLADHLEIVLVSPFPKETIVVSSNENPTPQPTKVKIDPSLGKPMVAAIYEGREEEAISLLNQGADPNTIYEGWSALLYAAYFGRTESVKALISHQVNSDFSVDGWNALRLSEVRGHTQIVTLLQPLTKSISRSLSKSPNPKSPISSMIKERNLRSEIEPSM